MTTLSSPVGRLTLASDGTALTGLWLDGQKHFPALPADAKADAELPVFRETAAWLEAYFSVCSLPPLPLLSLNGTPFQKRVWEYLLEIPYGKTVTYGAIAGEIRRGGGSASPRAVGGAVRRNPIVILIPCHRVLGTNGSLTGYAGGMQAKQILLSLEGIL